MDLNIFISYRRGDGDYATRSLYERLGQVFDPEKIFMDIDTIELGVDFVKRIRESVASCDVLIAVIGPNWLSAVDEKGQPRLNSPTDFVRLEIETALERDVYVIPALIGGVGMPGEGNLPDALSGLARRHGLEVGHTRFNSDVERLIRGLKKILESKERSARDRTAPPAETTVQAESIPETLPDTESDELFEWIKIPAGSFLMGAQATKGTEPNYDSEAYEDESPTHAVRLAAFEISRHPVTVGNFARFLDAGGYKDPAPWENGGPGTWSEPDGWNAQRSHSNHPVTGVSWLEACAFARWAGAQLPTEAQWERAARGTDGRRFPWGNTATSSKLLNYEANVGEPTPVGIYPKGATPEGICDLSGNVLEWCADWFASYEPGDEVDPSGPPDGHRRVLRGGAWFSDGRYCRGSCRFDFTPDARYLSVGFRLVRVSQAARTKA